MEALGINVSNLLIYIILFVVTYVILNKMFLPGFKKTLEQRQKEIQNIEALKKDAEQAKELAEKESNKALQAMQQEVNSNKEEIIVSANDEAKKILERAEKKAANILEEAKLAQEQMIAKLEKSYADDVKKGVVTLMKDVYKQDLKELDPALVKKSLDNLNFKK